MLQVAIFYRSSKFMMENLLRHVALERGDLSYTYLAHHELKSVLSIISNTVIFIVIHVLVLVLILIFTLIRILSLNLILILIPVLILIIVFNVIIVVIIIIIISLSILLLCAHLQDPDDDDIDDDTDTMLPPGEVRTGADVEAGEDARDEGLKPADIDAYWLQRNISKAYGNLDENEAVKKSEEVFNALQVGFCSCSLVVAPD